MGEAKRRKVLGLPQKTNRIKPEIDQSPRIFQWLPLTINQRDSLIKLSNEDTKQLSKGKILEKKYKKNSVNVFFIKRGFYKS